MSKVDKELQNLLSSSSDINNLLDSLEDDQLEEVNTPPKELVPTVFNDEATRVDDLNDYDRIYKFNVENLGGIITRSNAALDAVLKMAVELESPKLFDTFVAIAAASKDGTIALSKLAEARMKFQAQPTENTPSAVHNTQNNFYGYNIPDEEDEQLNKMLDGLDDENKTTKKTRGKPKNSTS